jgi:hypothetical protein
MKIEFCCVDILRYLYPAIVQDSLLRLDSDPQGSTVPERWIIPHSVTFRAICNQVEIPRAEYRSYLLRVAYPR